MAEHIHPKEMVRRKIREVLNMAPGYGKTEEQLFEYVNLLLNGGVSLQELRDEREWNHRHGLIRSEQEERTDPVLWYISQDGIAKQKSLT